MRRRRRLPEPFVARSLTTAAAFVCCLQVTVNPDFFDPDLDECVGECVDGGKYVSLTHASTCRRADTNRRLAQTTTTTHTTHVLNYWPRGMAYDPHKYSHFVFLMVHGVVCRVSARSLLLTNNNTTPQALRPLRCRAAEPVKPHALSTQPVVPCPQVHHPGLLEGPRRPPRP